MKDDPSTAWMNRFSELGRIPLTAAWAVQAQETEHHEQLPTAVSKSC